jgi:hypothetical protein
MAVGVTAFVAVVLVGAELLIRETSDRIGSPVSSVLCEVVVWATPLNLTGWACLAVPIAFMFVIALIFDTFMLGRRR